jgi:hypothetical protein
VSLPIAIETILQRLPISIRKSIARRPPFTSLLGVVDRRTRLNPNGRAVLSHNPPSPGSEVGREAPALVRRCALRYMEIRGRDEPARGGMGDA